MDNSTEPPGSLISPRRTRLIQLSSHSRHQSVPAIPSPQSSHKEGAHVTAPRGLAKLTLVERLSQEPSPVPTTSRGNASPRSESPNRSSHTRSRSRMSLSVLPAVRTPTQSINSPATNSPLCASPSTISPPVHTRSKCGSEGSESDIGTFSPVPASSRSSVEERSILDDSNATFLKLIASQERRVVELREELARAEAELDLLKQQWTQQLKRTISTQDESVRLIWCDFG